ncbi:hypothetical protein SDC9_94860 [bioreactor metagenome]|uniref:Uncharacterized protein n=2 Tax=root TaxID=1 RepID=A0A645A4Y1_9ZZZZ
MVSEILYNGILGETCPEYPRDEYDGEARLLVDEVLRRSVAGRVSTMDISDILASIFTDSFDVKYEAYEFEDLARLIHLALHACT